MNIQNSKYINDKKQKKSENQQEIDSDSKKYKPVSYRLPVDLLDELDNYCDLNNLKKTDFLKDAIKAHLQRSTILEVIDTKLSQFNTSEELQELIPILEKRINSIDDVVRQLTIRLDQRFIEINNNISTILAALAYSTSQAKEAVFSPANNDEIRVLEFLRTKGKAINIEDVIFQFQNIDIKLILEKLELSGKIKRLVNGKIGLNK